MGRKTDTTHLPLCHQELWGYQQQDWMIQWIKRSWSRNTNSSPLYFRCGWVWRWVDHGIQYPQILIYIYYVIYGTWWFNIKHYILIYIYKHTHTYIYIFSFIWTVFCGIFSRQSRIGFTRGHIFFPKIIINGLDFNHPQPW